MNSLDTSGVIKLVKTRIPICDAFGPITISNSLLSSLNLKSHGFGCHVFSKKNICFVLYTILLLNEDFLFNKTFTNNSRLTCNVGVIISSFEKIYLIQGGDHSLVFFNVNCCVVWIVLYCKGHWP